MQNTLYIPIDTTIDNPVECEKLVKRGDTVVLNIKVFSNGALTNLTGQSIDLILKKSDGTVIQKEIDASNISNGVVTATLSIQATVVSGLVSGELQLTDSNGQNSTNTFTFNVSTSVADNVIEVSKNDINVLNELRQLIADGEAVIAQYEEHILAIANSIEAIEALENIKSYIDTNLAALENNNAQAVVNTNNLKVENDKAPGLTISLKAQNDAATSNVSTLTTKNQEAVANKNNIDSSISVANTSKIALDTSNTNATNTKNALDTLNTTATNTKNALNTVNQTGQVLLNSLEEFEQEHADVTDISNQLANVNTQLSEKANQSDLQNESNTRQTSDSNLQSQISAITTKSDNYYVKCLSTDTNALLVVSSGATTGQINLASVTPHMSDYTPIAGDYVRLIINDIKSETVQARIDAGGTIHSTIDERIKFSESGNNRLSSLSALNNGYKNQLVGKWELGSISGTNGQNQAYNFLLRSVGYILGNGSIFFNLTSGYELYVYHYNSSKTFVNYKKYTTSNTITLTVGDYYRFVFDSATDTTPITDFTTFLSNLLLVSINDKMTMYNNIENDIATSIANTEIIDFKPYLTKSGYLLIDGTINSASANTWLYSDLITISDDVKTINYKLTPENDGSSTHVANILYYSKDKTLLGYTATSTVTTSKSALETGIATVLDNTRYIRLCSFYSTLSSAYCNSNAVLSSSNAETIGKIQSKQDKIKDVYTYNLGKNNINVIGDSMSVGVGSTDVPNTSYIGILRNLFSLEYGKNLNYGFVPLYDSINGISAGWFTKDIINASKSGTWYTTWNSTNIYANALLSSNVVGSKISFTSRKKFNKLNIAYLIGDYGKFNVKANGTIIKTIDCYSASESFNLDGNIDISAYDIGTTFDIEVASGAIGVSGVQFIDDGTYVTLNNFSCAGISTTYIPQTLFAKEANADTVIFAIGYNDTDTTAFATNINNYITILKSQNCKAIIVDLIWNENTNGARRKVLKSMAESLVNAVYIPFPDIVPKNSDGTIITGFLGADGVHPTDAGHQFIGETIAKQIGLSISSKNLALNVLGMKVI